MKKAHRLKSMLQAETRATKELSMYFAPVPDSMDSENIA